jgi:phosphoribosylglycinamide formyltransferase-1
MLFPKIAVFASGNGSNLQALLDRVRDGTLPAEISLVVSDRADAFALERGRTAGVETLLLRPKSYASRDAYDTALRKEIEARGIDWVVLAGFMRILDTAFVRSFLGRIVNVHPSLLPAYPGVRSIERAWKAGEREVGVTVHFVDEGVDTGPVIRQARIAVENGETLEGLTERVHRLEHRLYPEVVRDLVTGRVSYPKAVK